MGNVNQLRELLNNKHTSNKNRGMNLENDLNLSNEYYINNNIAFIYKKPTPIKIIKVNYPTKTNRNGDFLITKATFLEPSTTDYNGLYLGKYIDYEAKETNNKTSFPLDNIHKHQINHLRNIHNNNGIAFLIVRFNFYNETYLLFCNEFFKFIDNEKRKSIPYDFFKEKAHLIEEKYIPRLDYLKIVKVYLEEKE